MEKKALKPEQYVDMCLTCVSCGKNFDFPATEQDFFARHYLESPKRCRDCRNKKQKNSENLVQKTTIRKKEESYRIGQRVEIRDNLNFEKTKPSFLESKFKASESLPETTLLLLLIEEVKKLRDEVNQLRPETKTIKEELNNIYNILYDMDYDDDTRD